MQWSIEVALLALAVFHLPDTLLASSVSSKQDIKAVFKTLPRLENATEDTNRLWASVVEKFSSTKSGGDSGISRQIIGGSNAALGQFPWQALVYMDNTQMCGGSLIHPRFVLTAAQCAKGFTKFEVFLGTVRRSGSESTRQVFVSNKAYVHNNFDAFSLLNDIAIIKLPSYPTMSANLQTIMLPDGTVYNSFEGVDASTSGYGLTEIDGSASNVLRYTTMKVISNAECLAYYIGNVCPTNICTYATMTNTVCQGGDIGGPLVYRTATNAPWTLIGVISYTSGTECGHGPSVYTRVNSYNSWITAITDTEPITPPATTTSKSTAKTTTGRTFKTTTTKPPKCATANFQKMLECCKQRPNSLFTITTKDKCIPKVADQAYFNSFMINKQQLANTNKLDLKSSTAESKLGSVACKMNCFLNGLSMLDSSSKLIKSKFMEHVKNTQNAFWIPIIDAAYDTCAAAVPSYYGTYSSGSCSGHSLALFQCMQMRMVMACPSSDKIQTCSTNRALFDACSSVIINS